MPVDAQTINPTGRQLSLQTPLELNGSVIGNLLTTIDAKDTISFDSEALLGFLRDRVSNELIERLRAFGDQGAITADALKSAGIDTNFLLESLTVTMQIRPELLGHETLKVRDTRQLVEDLSQPAKISGYMNFRSSLSRSSSDLSDEVTQQSTSSVDSELRLGGPVLAFSLATSGGGRSSLSRRYARLLIDRPNKESRVTFGDVDIRSGSFSGSSQLTGFSIERDYGLTPGRNFKPTGQRQVSLSRRSKVTVIVSGVKLRTFVLDAGNYNVADIPLAEGYNNLVLQVEDDTGRIEVIDFSTLFTSELLAQGEIDYAFSAGWLPTQGEGSSVNLRDGYAAGGFIRYGALNTLTLGHSLQLSNELIIVDTEGVKATRFGPLSGAVGFSQSRDQKAGWALSTRFTTTTPISRQAFSWNVGVQLSSSDYRRSLNATTELNEFDDVNFSGSVGLSAGLPLQIQFGGGLLISAGMEQIVILLQPHFLAMPHLLHAWGGCFVSGMRNPPPILKLSQLT
jgi:outer membrane usher protein